MSEEKSPLLWHSESNPNRPARSIFGVTRDKITGQWRKLHNVELISLYYSPNIIWNVKSGRLRWAVHVARTEQSRNGNRNKLGTLEWKRPLGSLRSRWEENIKMDLKEVVCDAGVDRSWWIQEPMQRRAYRRSVKVLFRLNCAPHRLTVKAGSLLLVSEF